MMINNILFIGSKNLGLRVLKLMHSHSPSAIKGILTTNDSGDIRTRFSEITTFAEEHDLKIHVAANKKDAELFIREIQPELCIVSGWYWLISEAVINFVPEGFIGIHNSSTSWARSCMRIVSAVFIIAG